METTLLLRVSRCRDGAKPWIYSRSASEVRANKRALQQQPTVGAQYGRCFGARRVNSHLTSAFEQWLHTLRETAPHVREAAVRREAIRPGLVRVAGVKRAARASNDE